MTPTSSPRYLPVSTFCVQVPTWHGLLSVPKNGLIFSNFVAKEYTISYVFGCVFLLYYPTAFTWPVKLGGIILHFPVKILRCLGFGSAGVQNNSVASRYRYTYHGEYVIPKYPFAVTLYYGAIHHVNQPVPLYASLLQIGVAVHFVRHLFFA